MLLCVVLVVVMCSVLCAVCCVGGGCVVVCCAVCCVGGGCVVVCCVLCTNITKLTYPLAVSGDGVPHELPSVSVSV